MVGRTVPSGDAGVLLVLDNDHDWEVDEGFECGEEEHLDHAAAFVTNDTHEARLFRRNSARLRRRGTLVRSDHIPSLIAADIAAALGASALVAPFVSIIDRAIIQNQSGAARLEASLWEGCKDFARRPLAFLRRPEVLMVAGVYGITYTTANLVNTTAKAYQYQPDMPKLVGTTAANMTAAIAKDRAYARMFGVVAPRSLPALSYLCFLSRDVTTMGASFNIPDPLSAHLVSTWGVSKYSANVAAQLICPVAMQVFTTPMHLLGLDYYNRPNQTFAERWAIIAANYQKTVLARIARILPAFGFGGLGNKMLRTTFHDWAITPTNPRVSVWQPQQMAGMTPAGTQQHRPAPVASSPAKTGSMGR